MNSSSVAFRQVPRIDFVKYGIFKINVSFWFFWSCQSEIAPWFIIFDFGCSKPLDVWPLSIETILYCLLILKKLVHIDYQHRKIVPLTVIDSRWKSMTAPFSKPFYLLKESVAPNSFSMVFLWLSKMRMVHHEHKMRFVYVNSCLNWYCILMIPLYLSPLSQAKPTRLPIWFPIFIEPFNCFNFICEKYTLLKNIIILPLGPKPLKSFRINPWPLSWSSLRCLSSTTLSLFSPDIYCSICS